LTDDRSRANDDISANENVSRHNGHVQNNTAGVDGNNYINKAVDEISRNMLEAVMENNKYINEITNCDDSVNGVLNEGVNTNNGTMYMNEKPVNHQEIWWEDNQEKNYTSVYINKGDNNIYINDNVKASLSLASFETSTDGYIEICDNNNEDDDTIVSTPGYGKINKVRRRTVVPGECVIEDDHGMVNYWSQVKVVHHQVKLS
jgi:hypothetical protein